MNHLAQRTIPGQETGEGEGEGDSLFSCWNLGLLFSWQQLQYQVLDYGETSETTRIVVGHI